jgi:choline dehydrogenase-like flavoprotein
MGTLWRGILKGAIGPRNNDSRYLLDVHTRDLPGEQTMRRYADTDEVDLVIVGAGAGGSVLAQRLARHGWRVVIIEAGPFWHPDEDWVSDEAGSHPLYWTQKRIIGGADPIELGKNNSGRGVGGSMVHYAGYTPRFHPSDFSTYTDDGVGADWPISYEDLRPHYEQVEAELLWPGRTGPGATHTATPSPRTRSPEPPRSCARARCAAASRCGSAPSASSTAPSATARTASTAATACRAARSTPKPARTSPTCPMR